MSHTTNNQQVPGTPPVQYHKAVVHFMDELPASAQAFTVRSFELLSEFGSNPEMVDVKHIQGKLWELRVNISKPNRLRMRYFFICKDGQYQVLHAYHKQTNEAPRRHIELALSRVQR